MFPIDCFDLIVFWVFIWSYIKNYDVEFFHYIYIIMLEVTFYDFNMSFE